MDLEQKETFPQCLRERLSGDDFQLALKAAMGDPFELADSASAGLGDIFSVGSCVGGAASTPLGINTVALCHMAFITGNPFGLKKRDSRTRIDPAQKRMEAEAALRKGFIDILRSFLESRDDEFDVEAIEATIRELTESRNEDVVANVLKPLYIKESGVLTEQRLKTVAENLYDFLKPHLKIRKPKTAPKRTSGDSSFKGPKTKTMDRQLKDFMNFVAARKYAKGRGKPAGTYELANNFWCHNKTAFEASAKASGEARGYGNYRVLANAYNTLRAEKARIRQLP